MTTLTLPASHPRKSAGAGFGRFFAALTTVLDVFADAQRMAAEAHQRFPFARW